MIFGPCLRSTWMRMPFRPVRHPLFSTRYLFNSSRSSAVPASVNQTSIRATSVLGRWLLGLTGMTFGAILLGGVTRLTESGLSMVDWHPFKEVPPFKEEYWQAEFEKYKNYVKEHGEMSFNRFKFIWYMEFIHRMWGRTIGAAFVFPAVYFFYKGYFSSKMKYRVFIYGGLIGLQGVLGWLMVRSGLKEPRRPAGLSANENYVGVPRVDHYWLCAHLISAIVLYSLLLWNSFSHLASHPEVSAFVAGLDAGLIYNSWPKMADRWIPDDLIVSRYGSTVKNFLDNPTAVQFTHRMLAYTTVLTTGLLWIKVMRLGVTCTGPRIRNAAHLVLGAAFGQSLLGITTLLYYVPVSLGSLHQCGGVILLSSLLWFTHCLHNVPK
ncbi:Cytochrome c oxidase assembly protein COX15 like [Schistosoma japonicum]|nr:Cytochrome c oxidase assembly protein COX15 like [Schistosoma japonicum]